MDLILRLFKLQMNLTYHLWKGQNLGILHRDAGNPGAVAGKVFRKSCISEPAISDWEVTRLINELQKLLDK